ncbi:hypothetical protein THAOC_32741, partial [Thalassiosira oceanica]
MTEAQLEEARALREARRRSKREATERRRRRRLERTRSRSPSGAMGGDTVIETPLGCSLSSDPPQQASYAVGTLVQIDGLTVAPQFNKCIGRLVRYDKRSQRWGVRLHDGGQYVGVTQQHLSRAPRDLPPRRVPTTPIDDPSAVAPSFPASRQDEASITTAVVPAPVDHPAAGSPPEPLLDGISMPPAATPGASVPAVASSASSAVTLREAGLADRTVECSQEHSELSPTQQIDALFPASILRRPSRSKKRRRRGGDRVVVFVKANSVSKMTRCDESSAVADTGATHDLHNRLRDFVTFQRLSNQFVELPNKAKLPILGVGNIVVDLGGRRILLRGVYYVPDLRVPLFSLRVHRRRPGCGHHADNDGFIVTFPSFDVDVDDKDDSYIPFRSVSVSEDMSVSALDYVEPSVSERAAISASNGALRRSQRLRAKRANQTSDWDRVVGGDFDGDFDKLDDECVEIDIVDETLHSDEVPPADSPAGDASVPPAPTAPVSESAPVVATTSAPGDPKTGRSTTGENITADLLLSFHADPTVPAPAVRPCDTPNDSDTKAVLTPDIIHRLTGGRRFRGQNGYRNHATVLRDGTASFTNGGEPLQTLGEVVNQVANKRGGSLPPTKHYLEKVHMDIVFGDVISKLGYRYALLLVDRATKYIWVYGVKSLTAVNIIAALEEFRADAGGLPKQFRCDCDQKLLGGNARRWIYRNNSKVIGAPAGRQSANGLVERAWQTMCSMARAYLTDAGMSRDYWYFAIAHAARMMNYIPGKVEGKLTTSFELVHRVRPDGRTFFPLFSIVYFSLNKSKSTENAPEDSGDRSTFMSRSQVGIAVGRSTTTNALRVYSPSTKSYYEPETYKFDPSRRPSNEWPDKIQYDGGLYVNLYRDSHHNKVPEPYPPGMPFKLPGEGDELID